jgi:pyridoxal phosphate-dependent aminotransferase EpsN
MKNETDRNPHRLYLSPPHLSGQETARLAEALASNYIAPVGPQLEAFERAFAAQVGLPYTLALSSGTAALHLAFRALGVGPGDIVFCSTLTFIASIAPAVQLGATPVFIDADATSWCMDPDVLGLALAEAAAHGRLPKAVVAVDLYGQSCDMHRIVAACHAYGVPVIEDAAEALGATYQGAPVGQRADLTVYSFNGNKIITTSGGGMLASRDGSLVEKCRFWSTQARDPAPHYQHTELGYNYRLSNLLAAVGCAQLAVLGDRVAARREIYQRYVALFADLPGVACMPEAAYGVSSHWLTVLLLDPVLGIPPEQLRLALEVENMEARPVWKPMHLQPVFAACAVWTARGLSAGGRPSPHDAGPTNKRSEAVADRLFRQGLCLPSGSAMTAADQARVIQVIRRIVGGSSVRRR